MPTHLKTRNGIWHYHRRVPAIFADLDRRGWVVISLQTRDLKKAERLKPAIERELEAYWVALKRGESNDAYERYLGAIERCRLEGFEYREAAEIAAGDIADLFARIRRLEELNAFGQAGLAAPRAVAALLGGEPKPGLTITKGLERFFELTRDQVHRKSEAQLRHWKAVRMRSVTYFIELVGDKRVTDITRSDALALRAFWTERVIEEGYAPNSANKNIGHLNQILNTLNEMLELGIGKPFAGLRLEDTQANRRAAFEVDYLRDLVMDPTKLAGLNPQALHILHVMVETGLRPIEICGLDPEDILLEAEVSHVKVRPKPGRELKTPYSERDMPLVGISLEAMRQNPNGFPRYADKSAGLSATVNKLLKERELLPSERHSLYSIRHTFVDRLNAAGIPDRYQVDLIGHKFDRPKYGEGQTLAEKRDLLLRLAIT